MSRPCCLRCGALTAVPGVSVPTLLCSECLPVGTSYRQTLTARLPSTYRFVHASPDRDDLGPFGTEAEPRAAAVDLSLAMNVIEQRPGEKVTIRLPLPVRFKALIAYSNRRPSLEITLTYNVWRRDRRQYEDQLIYIDRDANAYLELWCRASTDFVTWTSGEQTLSTHHHGGSRRQGDMPSWVRLPLGVAGVSDLAQPGH